MLINKEKPRDPAASRRLRSHKASPTFWLVGVCRGDVLREQPEPLLALVVQPQVHLPPGLVLLRRLSLEVPLTVAHPQLVRVLREPLREEGWRGRSGHFTEAATCSSDCTITAFLKTSPSRANEDAGRLTVSLIQIKLSFSGDNPPAQRESFCCSETGEDSFSTSTFRMLADECGLIYFRTYQHIISNKHISTFNEPLESL